MKKFIMMVGLPASGKSTIAKKYAEKENAIIISTDELREELLGDEASQENNELVFKDDWEGLVKELYPIGTVLGFLNLTEDSIEKEEIRMATIFSGKWKWIGNGPGGPLFERIK